MKQQQKSGAWYAVLTAEVLTSKDLNNLQKLIFALVSNLQNASGYCWASNEYLAEALNTSERTIQRNVKGLVDRGYLFREVVKTKDGSNRILSVNTNPPAKNDVCPHDKNDTPHTTNLSPTHTTNLSCAYIRKEKQSTIKNKVGKEKEADPIEKEFTKLWEVYDVKKAKQNAYKAFKRLKKSEHTQVLEHAQKFKENHETNNKRQFQPHLATYLNQKRYLEDMPYTNQGQGLGTLTERKNF